jgi:hypothetical protein
MPDRAYLARETAHISRVIPRLRVTSGSHPGHTTIETDRREPRTAVRAHHRYAGQTLLIYVDRWSLDKTCNHEVVGSIPAPGSQRERFRLVSPPERPLVALPR